jgi:hypothetical protein
LLDDFLNPPEDEFVDFAAYGEIIPIGPSRPPRDVFEPRLWTLTHDTARHLNSRTPAAYDEYLHIGCNAFFNAAASEDMGELSFGVAISTEHQEAVALLRASHRTRMAAEENARSRLGYIYLTNVTNVVKVFA